MTFDTNAPAAPLAFAPLSLPQMAQVESIRLASGNTLYTYTFPTLFAWQATEQYEICLQDDAYLIRNGARGANAYLFPCGSEAGKRRLINALLQHGAPVFYFMSDADKAFLEMAYPRRFSFSACRNDYPYLYDKEAQIALNGKAFKRLRHQINQGRAAAERWSSEPLTAQNIDRALSLNRRWAAERSDGIQADLAATETALLHFAQLSMWGRLFQADGADVAFAAGSFVTLEKFDINFCKVLDKRCDCFIKWALYGALPAEVKLIDSEEDMGLDGLRKHKMLRVPMELTRVWKGSLKV